jgi:hypothetical protein
MTKATCEAYTHGSPLPKCPSNTPLTRPLTPSATAAFRRDRDCYQAAPQNLTGEAPEHVAGVLTSSPARLWGCQR